MKEKNLEKYEKFLQQLKNIYNENENNIISYEKFKNYFLTKTCIFNIYLLDCIFSSGDNGKSTVSFKFY